jgi:hypothetical protein
VLFTVLKVLSNDHLRGVGPLKQEESSTVISAVAGVLDSIIETDRKRLGLLATWLTSPSGAGLGEGVGIRRAVLAVIAKDNDSILSVLEKSIRQFGDLLYIKHSPVLQQEGMPRNNRQTEAKLTRHSSRPSFAPQCRILAQKGSRQTRPAHEIEYVVEHHIQ